MSRKLLLLALAVVSFAAVCVSLDLAAAMDSEAEADRPMDQPYRNMSGSMRGNMKPPCDVPVEGGLTVGVERHRIRCGSSERNLYRT